jgi:hypothetical protein
MSANRQYKSSVFSLLFNNEAAVRELYEALEGVTLPPDTPVVINTLEGALFRNRLNDVSFEIAGKVVLVAEHQSTINPNMPIRLLIYIARLYEKLLAGKNLYGKKGIPIPRPEIIVLYNGPDPYPDEGILKLSDMFENAAELGIPVGEPPAVEVIVKVYNINSGHNEERLKKSQALEGYSVFIAKAREFEAETAQGREKPRLTAEERTEAMRRAVTWCIDNGILKEFLERNGSEVVNMLFEEWDMDTALAVEREEGREEGWGQVLDLLAQGYSASQIRQMLAEERSHTLEASSEAAVSYS